MSGSLAAEHLSPRLRGRFGRPYVYVARCDSTQRVLALDAPEGALAATDEQTKGRGRLGRTWHAPPGSSVLCSIILRPPVDAGRLPELSIVAGQAVAEAIEAVAGVTPELKFPNDVLLDGRKVAGVLAESSEGRVTLGIGINVSQSDDELPAAVVTPATSLLLATGRDHDRGELLAAVLERLERLYDEWVSGARGGSP